MRTKKMGLRIAAGVAAFVLIGILLFAANEFVGNPISASIAKSAINEHLKATYPEMPYTFDSKVNYNFKDGSYHAWIQSAQSRDTRFSVEYRGRGRVTDDYDFQVKQFGQTILRLEKEFALLLQNKLTDQSAIPLKSVQVLFDTENMEAIKPHLQLDMPLDPQLPIPFTIYLNMQTDDSYSLSQLSGYMEQAYALAKREGYYIVQYGAVAETADQLLSVYGVRPSHMDGGSLMPVLEQALAQGEYDGVIVIKKGD